MSTITAAPPRLLPVLALVTTLVLWASAFIVIRHLGHSISPGALSLLRMTIAASTLTPALLIGGRRPRMDRTEVLLLLTCGAAWFGLNSLLLNAAEQLIDAATAALLTQVGPLLITLLAVAFLGERLTPQVVVGMVVAFAGVLVIGIGSHAGGSLSLFGILVALAAAATYAVGVVCQKALLSSRDSVEVTALSMWIGAAVCLPWAAEAVEVVTSASTGNLVLLAYFGVFPTALAFATWAYALTHTEAGKLAIATFLAPVIAAVMAWLILRETPPWPVYPGGALCILGVMLSGRTPRERGGDPGHIATSAVTPSAMPDR